MKTLDKSSFFSISNNYQLACTYITYVFIYILSSGRLQISPIILKIHTMPAHTTEPSMAATGTLAHPNLH